MKATLTNIYTEAVKQIGFFSHVNVEMNENEETTVISKYGINNVLTNAANKVVEAFEDDKVFFTIEITYEYSERFATQFPRPYIHFHVSE